jgi:hypothetical protein
VEEQYRRFGGRVAFLAVCLGIRRSMADYVRENGVTLPVAFDEGEEAASAFGARVPTFVLVDSEGRITYKAATVPEDLGRYLPGLDD